MYISHHNNRKGWLLHWILSTIFLIQSEQYFAHKQTHFPNWYVRLTTNIVSPNNKMIHKKNTALKLKKNGFIGMLAFFFGLRVANISISSNSVNILRTEIYKLHWDHLCRFSLGLETHKVVWSRATSEYGCLRPYVASSDISKMLWALPTTN